MFRPIFGWLAALAAVLPLAFFSPVATAQPANALTEAGAKQLTPEGHRQVDIWRTSVALVREELSALPPPKDASEELSRLAQLDRAAREGVAEILSGPATSDRGWVIAAIFTDIGAIDRSNSARLAELLPASGWFVGDAYRESASTDAWLLTQHSPDLSLQKEVLRRLENLISTYGIEPGQYAALYDRVTLKEGRPQRYGTHAACEDGQWVWEPIQAASAVVRDRAIIGWSKPLNVSARELSIGGAC